MKKFTIVLALVVAFSAIFVASAAFAADGVVDSNIVLANFPKFQRAQQQLAQLAQAKQAEINAEKNRDKQQQLAQQAQQQLAAEQQKLFAPLFKEARDAAIKVAKAKKLNMVHEQASVIYGGVDITKDVVAELTK